MTPGHGRLLLDGIGSPAGVTWRKRHRRSHPETEPGYRTRLKINEYCSHRILHLHRSIEMNCSRWRER
jgi:hypothetical protein